MRPATLRPYLPTSALRRRIYAYQVRHYAVQAPGAPTLQVFNRQVKQLQKERGALNVGESRKVDYLRDEVAARLTERLLVSTSSCKKMHELPRAHIYRTSNETSLMS